MHSSHMSTFYDCKFSHSAWVSIEKTTSWERLRIACLLMTFTNDKLVKLPNCKKAKLL